VRAVAQRRPGGIRPMGKKKSQSGWHAQTGGRSVETEIVDGRILGRAILSCSSCPEKLTINMATSFLPDDVLDKKALFKGWEVDPAVCPTCRLARRKKREKAEPTTAAESEALCHEEMENDETMGITIEPPTKSVNAVKGTLAAIRVLDENFDPKTGKYAEGWSDEVIAEKTGIALAQVIAFRLEGFGELAAPSELAKLNDDIRSLERLFNEQVDGFKAEMAQLRARAAELGRAVRR
jgi:hypothetical protein